MSRIVLVGFMACGKTAVGRALAALLGWEFIDFDELIEERAARSIPEIFRDEGEAGFRRLEEAVGQDLVARDEVILAPGGGWAATAGRIPDLPPRTLSVWLRVSPETAMRRDRKDDVERPLLARGDAAETARRLLAEREPFYRMADWTLDSEEEDVKSLARRIADRVRRGNVTGSRGE